MKIDFSTLGVSGLNHWGNDVYDEFLPNLQYPRAAKVYREMADNDPTIGAIIYMAEQLIRKTPWRVEEASKSPEDLANAKFLEECMDDMSMTWADMITEALSMLVYGFSFHEIVYKIRRGPEQLDPKFRSNYNDGKIGWRKIAGRAQNTMFGWEFDENDGDVVGYIQQAPPKFEQVTIPLSKGLLFRTKSVRNNPEGRSLLRNAYRPWYFKKRIEEIEGIGIERDLAGLPMLTPAEDVDIWDPENPDAVRTRNYAESLVKNVKRDRSEGIVIPFGWEFKLVSTGGTRQFDTNAIINRYDNRIAITMLADIVMMGGDKVGSFALGEVKKSLLAASLEAQINNIADVFNKYAVPTLFKLNGNITAAYPKIRPGEIEVPDVKDVAFILRAGGLDITKDIKLMNMIRRLLSIDPLTPEEFKKLYTDPAEEEKKTTINTENEETTEENAETSGKQEDNNTNRAKTDNPIPTIDNMSE